MCLSYRNPNTISSCRKCASSSILNTASVSIISNGKKRLFKLFFSAFTTYNKSDIINTSFIRM